MATELVTSHFGHGGDQITLKQYRGLHLGIQFTSNPELTINTITKHLWTATLGSSSHICDGYEEFI